MLKFRLFKTDISMCFSFFAIIALLLLWDGTSYALLGLIACLVHEMGHILVMCWCSIPPKKITFYGAGIKITPNYEKITSAVQDFFVLIAGSLTNLIVFSVLYPLSQNNFQTALFASINLVIGIFNMIPFRHFDGGMIIDLLINTSAIKNAAILRKVITIISISLLAALGIAFAVMQKGNISLYLSIGYIIFSELML